MHFFVDLNEVSEVERWHLRKQTVDIIKYNSKNTDKKTLNKISAGMIVFENKQHTKKSEICGEWYFLIKTILIIMIIAHLSCFL